MNAPWPPPPDRNSIRELVRTADTESFISMTEAPPDEYDGEADELFAAIGRWPTEQITSVNLLPVIEKIWSKSFNCDADIRERLRPTLQALADEIARFFGPEAQPQVRERSEAQ
jgi:hypothetical protein